LLQRKSTEKQDSAGRGATVWCVVLQDMDEAAGKKGNVSRVHPVLGHTGRCDVRDESGGEVK
jgi:hypothetical protein